MELREQALDDAFATLRAAFPQTECTEASERALRGWLLALVAWNKKLDLTAARSTAELFDLMLVDAFALAPHFPKGASVVDVGSGAGAPGFPIALLRPDLKMMLVEPLAKRTSFLRTVSASIGRTDITILRGKGEDLLPETATNTRRFSVAISRATLAPPAWLALGEQLAPEGEVWVLTARDAPPVASQGVRCEGIPYEWPFTSAHRLATKYVLTLA